VRSFTESYLSDIDNIVPFENTTRSNQNIKVIIFQIYILITRSGNFKRYNVTQNKRMQSRLIRLIGVVFSNGAMLSVSDKFDSVNECTQEIGELMKLHIQGVWRNVHKFVKQLVRNTNCD